jgi:hypothetical protein
LSYYSIRSKDLVKWLKFSSHPTAAVYIYQLVPILPRSILFVAHEAIVSADKASACYSVKKSSLFVRVDMPHADHVRFYDFLDEIYFHSDVKKPCTFKLC